MSRRTMSAAVAVFGCLALAQGALAEMETVRHRAEARRSLEACREAAVCERWLSDGDAEIRKYALAKLFACDEARARTAAQRMKADASPNVKALAENILRPKAVSVVFSRIPLSQDKSVDHEILRVKTLVPKDGRFRLPSKIDSDAVELWFSKTPTGKVIVLLNGAPTYAFDPAKAEGRAFRADVTEAVRWEAENEVRVTDETGIEQKIPFEVEVLKCGG